MEKLRRNIILSLFFVLVVAGPMQAEFDASVIMADEKSAQINSSEEISANETAAQEDFSANELESARKIINLDDKKLRKKDFTAITSKFNQGNARVAYDEYDQLIESMDDDWALFSLHKVLYEMGFFSLANKAADKIVNLNRFYDNLLDLEKCYKPNNELSVDEEIYFAKLYSEIYFDNSAQEAIYELSRKCKYPKKDYYFYTLSRANLVQKQNHAALNAINKAIALNPDCLNYQIFKVDALIASKKYKDAKNLIAKIEKTKTSINFTDKIEIQKETIASFTTRNDKEKKYHIANQNYLEGNFEKVKKDCKNILNFDKDNYKIMAMYAKSELALGNIENANTYFVNSYKIQKKNVDALVGLGDMRYLNGDYKNAVKMYKKAYKIERENYEILIKLAAAQRQYGKNRKDLQKYEQLLDKMPKEAYLDYYRSAISLAQKNDVLKEEFLRRTLNVNPVYENAIVELASLYLKNKNYPAVQKLIKNASYTLEKSYYYYYLCGLYNQNMNKRKEAAQFYKTALNLNPNFEIANKKLLNLIPDNSGEEI